MQDINKSRPQRPPKNKFALDPLPAFKDLPRPLKSLEAAHDPMAPGFAFDTNLLTKEAFIAGLDAEFQKLGIDDPTKQLHSKVLELCAHEGLYRCPTVDLLRGISVGWFCKPVPPPISEAFEHAQTDFHNEMLRLMRDSEARCKRLVTMAMANKGTNVSSQTMLSRSTQFKNIEDPTFVRMAWVVCYVLSLVDVPKFFQSRAWVDNVMLFYKKKWLVWGNNLYEKYKDDPQKVKELGKSARSSFVKLAPFKDGTLAVNSTDTHYYNTEAEFLKAIEDTTSILRRTQDDIDA